jgi:hypothetical protein
MVEKMDKRAKKERNFIYIMKSLAIFWSIGNSSKE